MIKKTAKFHDKIHFSFGYNISGTIALLGAFIVLLKHHKLSLAFKSARSLNVLFLFIKTFVIIIL